MLGCWERESVHHVLYQQLVLCRALVFEVTMDAIREFDGRD